MSLDVAHCFGFDPETGLEYADTAVLVALCGNGFQFSSVERDSRSQFLWGAGTSISCYAINRRARLLAYSEKGLSPRIFIHDLLTHELVRPLTFSQAKLISKYILCDTLFHTTCHVSYQVKAPNRLDNAGEKQLTVLTPTLRSS